MTNGKMEVGWRPLYTYDMPDRDALLLALADAVTALPGVPRETRLQIEELAREVRGNAKYGR